MSTAWEFGNLSMFFESRMDSNSVRGKDFSQVPIRQNAAVSMTGSVERKTTMLKLSSCHYAHVMVLPLSTEGSICRIGLLYPTQPSDDRGF